MKNVRLLSKDGNSAVERAVTISTFPNSFNYSLPPEVFRFEQDTKWLMARGQNFTFRNTGKFNIVFFEIEFAVNNVTFWSLNKNRPDCISLLLLSRNSNLTPDWDCTLSYDESLRVDFPRNLNPFPEFLGSLAAPFFDAHSRKGEIANAYVKEEKGKEN